MVSRCTAFLAHQVPPGPDSLSTGGIIHDEGSRSVPSDAGKAGGRFGGHACWTATYRTSRRYVRDSPFRIDCRGRILDARPGRAIVMGILNVTPDSFSDGGRFSTPGAALARAEQMLRQGAQIIDIGGESTRPAGETYGSGAEPISGEAEIRRILPVIERIAADLPEAILSVDTYKAEVAEAALEVGAHMLNDITGLRHDSKLATVAARYRAPVVVMHSRGGPGSLPHEQRSEEDVVDEVMEALQVSIRSAEEAGVRDVIVDPGFGFGKSPRENLRLLAATGEFLGLGRPVMVGVSRKSTIGTALGSASEPAPVERRLFGSLGATAVAVLRGASIVRTHDVRETSEMLRLLIATTDAGEDRVSTLAGEEVSR
jgi:dihydropteroate synthase